MPELHSIKRRAGIAGQYSLDVVVSYPDHGDDELLPVSFVSDTFGGPIVMVCAGFQDFVAPRTLDRIGRNLDEAWVRRFFA